MLDAYLVEYVELGGGEGEEGRGGRGGCQLYEVHRVCKKFHTQTGD